MRDKKLFKDYTIVQLLLKLRNIKIVEMENGKIYLTEVSKKQWELYHKFDIRVPLQT